MSTGHTATSMYVRNEMKTNFFRSRTTVRIPLRELVIFLYENTLISYLGMKVSAAKEESGFSA